LPTSASASPRLKTARRRHRERFLLPFLLAFTGPVLLFALLAHGVREGRTFSWDRELVAFFDTHYYDFQSLRRVVETLVYFGIGVGAAASVLVLVVLVRSNRRRHALFWALAVGGAVVMAPVLKVVFQRPQIGEPGEYSFPSGNATASLAIAVSAYLLVSTSRPRPLIALAGAGVVALYGLGLVVLLWHYPSDIVGGWCVALAWVTALWLALREQGSGCIGRNCGVNTR
jgi:membrane-associated phospholipid phosphatase